LCSSLPEYRLWDSPNLYFFLEPERGTASVKLMPISSYIVVPVKYRIPLVFYVPRGLAFTDSSLCPQSSFVFFMGLGTNSDYFHMKHRLTDLFITQAGLVYCAVRGEYSIFFVLSRFTYFLLLISMATSAGESVVMSMSLHVGELLLSHEVRIADSFCA